MCVCECFEDTPAMAAHCLIASAAHLGGMPQGLACASLPSAPATPLIYPLPLLIKNESLELSAGVWGFCVLLVPHATPNPIFCTDYFPTQVGPCVAGSRCHPF